LEARVEIATCQNALCEVKGSHGHSPNPRQPAGNRGCLGLAHADEAFQPGGGHHCFLKSFFMLKNFAFKLLLAGCTCLAALSLPADPAKSPKPAIYDEKADGSQQVTDALATAQTGHKRVLLIFGANWCGWCHRLHTLFGTDKEINDTLKADFVLVLIDVNKGHNKAVNDKYSNPIQHGLPVLVVLDTDGRQLTTKDTGELEEGDHHSPQKVLAFLKAWLRG